MKTQFIHFMMILILLATSHFGSQTFAQSNAADSSISVVGHWPNGPCYAAFVLDNFAYIGNGTTVDILDVSDKTAPTKIGRIAVGNVVEKIRVADGYAYIIARNSDLLIYDVSDPSSPFKAGSYKSPKGFATDVVISGKKTYVSVGRRRIDPGGGLCILDTSSPSSPQLIDYIDIGGTTGNLAVHGNLAFVTVRTAIGIVFIYKVHIVDLGAKGSPQVIGILFVDANGLCIAGDYVYIADSMDGLHIINISTPASPENIHLISMDEAMSVYVYNDLAYVTDRYDGLHIFDVSSPNDPIEIGFLKTNDFAWDLFLSGNHVFLANRDDGLSIVDVSNPEVPTNVGTYATGGAANGVFISGPHAYVASRGAGLSIIDIRDVTSPQIMGYLNGLPTKSRALYAAERVHVSDDYAYIACGGSGLYIIDISDPENPIRTGHVINGDIALDVFASGSYAYVAFNDKGLCIFDISNPVSPKQIGTFGTGGDAYGVSIAGNLAFVSDRGHGVHIIDISNPTSPRLIGICGEGQAPIDVAISGENAFVAAQPNGLRIWDFGTLSSPQQIGLYKPQDTWARGISLSGFYAYIADQNLGGVSVLDVTFPSTPRYVGFFPVAGFPSDVHAFEAIACVAAEDAGLYILQNDFISNAEKQKNSLPAAFNLLQNYPNPFNPTTSIEYELPRSAYIRITISDISGCHIKTLVNQQQGIGRFQTSWDGMNERSTPVAGGVYFCHLQAGEYNDVVKMLLVK